jgi:ABC-type sulfate transport system permease component
VTAFSGNGSTNSVRIENAPVTGAAPRLITHLQQHLPSACAGAIAMAAALLALLPLLSLIVLAFGETGDLWDHLLRHVIPVALARTAVLLAGVAALTIVLGAGTAYLVTTFSFPGRDTLAWLLPLPLAIPTYIVAYVYVDLLDALGPLQSILPNVRSLGGAIFLFGVVLYPYVYLAARAMLQTQGAMFAEPARMLGARPWQLARRITLPLARPAIAVGVSLALFETLNDIGACEYLGVSTLTLSIFTTWLNRGSLAGAAQISCLMLLIVAALIALERRSRRRDFAVSAHDTRRIDRIVLTGPSRWIAAGACLVRSYWASSCRPDISCARHWRAACSTGWTRISSATPSSRSPSPPRQPPPPWHWALRRSRRGARSSIRSSLRASGWPASAMPCRERCWRSACSRRSCSSTTASMRWRAPSVMAVSGWYWRARPPPPSSPT